MWRALLLLLWVAQAQKPWAAGEALPVWTLQGDSARVVLLGSVHMAGPEIYPLRAAIESAFRQADTLVVEVDISGANGLRIQQMMLERGRLPEGDSLEDHLPAETWERLQQYLKGRGLPVELVAQLHPALVVATLTSLRLTELGLRSELGIDRHFLEQRPAGMRLLELETPEQQIELLLGFPDPGLLVEQTLVQLSEIEDYMQPVYAAWRAGDGAALHRLLREEESARHPEFQPIYEKLFDERNRAMAGRIEQFLEGGGNYFVVVGAGHLVGPEGIIALLAGRGFDAEPL